MNAYRQKTVRKAPKTAAVFILWCLLCVQCISAFSQDTPAAEVHPITFPPYEDSLNISPRIKAFRDYSGGITLEKLLKTESAALLQPNKGLDVNFGIGSKPVWIAFSLHNPSTEESDWILEFTNPRLGRVHWYEETPYRDYQHWEAGARLPFFSREVLHINPAFAAKIPPGETRTYYAKIEHLGSLRFQLMVWQRLAFDLNAEQKLTMMHIYLGVMIAMVVYNLLIFFGLREAGYLYYTLFILIYLMYHMCFNGAAARYFWPDAPWWGERAVVVFFALTIASAAIFARTFVRGSEYAPRWARMVSAVAVVNVGIAMIGLSSWTVKNLLSHLSALISPVIIVILALQCARKGYRPARLLVAAFGMVAAAIAVFTFVGLGIIPSTPVTENLVPAALVGAVMLLSLALARRVRVNEDETRNQLEQTVAERTSDLTTAINQMKTLSGLLPICASCKKIRDDKGYWETVESYISQHADVGFSHSVCPDCMQKLYPEYCQPESAPSSKPCTEKT